MFRFIQLLPGIAAASDYSSGLHIRGGSITHFLADSFDGMQTNEFRTQSRKTILYGQNEWHPAYSWRINNIYDYYRSQDVRIGDTSQPPGHIDNIISNVEGGHGLFGGMSVVRFEIYVDYPPGFHSIDRQ